MDDLDNEIKALDTRIARLEENLSELQYQIFLDRISLRIENLLKHGAMNPGEKEVEE